MTLSFQEGKPTVWSLAMVRGAVIGDKQITAYAAKAAHVPETTIAVAQEALFDAVNYFCNNGHTVQVPNLGGFSLGLRVKCVKTKEEATAETIKQQYIRFFPKHELRNKCMLNNINVTVSKGLSDEE